MRQVNVFEQEIKGRKIPETLSETIHLASRGKGVTGVQGKKVTFTVSDSIYDVICSEAKRYGLPKSDIIRGAFLKGFSKVILEPENQQPNRKG